MGIGTAVIIGISAWIVLSLPVGLLIGAMVRTSRRAAQRPGPSATTRAALTRSAHTPRRNRIAELAQV